MECNIYVFRTSLRNQSDIETITPDLDNSINIISWNVDLDNWENILRVECCGLGADDIAMMLHRQGYSCSELEYLPKEKTLLHKFHDCMLPFVLLFLLCFALTPCCAQVITDSLADDFRSITAKNFSRYRTVNFSYETKWAHDYTFSLDGKEVEKGRKKNLHTMRFSTMVPLLKLRKVSLYANVQYACYKFDNYGDATSIVFNNDTYDYYSGGINGSYYMSLFNRPLILSADIIADGWDEGFGKLHGRASAVMVITNTGRTSFSAGIMGMTLFSSIPVMPVIAFWHKFNNPNLSVDITMPSQFYLRYQMTNQRISVGASMTADNFYLKTDLEGKSSVYYYSDAVLKPEIHYEYIINRHFYLSAHAGLSMVMKGGLYTKNRKGVKIKNEDGKTEVEPIVKQDRSPVPFINAGISYSLFK